ncbi:TetR/AcrR family transcriptional regulator [Haloimpatiens massiliensis]|uniref:TetR/AcrR family transcriptional regulator n=1 Tax=Haloimpatiens massiliensis TaxID=1658110 RepID=UPI000C830289|nr:TetR/AcrR family transcriptional regulator [Haloimpatiens massiliensis]
MIKKTLQQKRMMSYFIDATNQIIQMDGIENVTIRKVADIAGYNSATLYNYFKNLDHLILFASMKYLREYVENLPEYIKRATNSLDRYFLIWECFCNHSFKRPKIYNLVFFSEFSNTLNDTISEYYSIFPDELADSSLNLNSMLLGNTLYKRTLSIINDCVKDGFISAENVHEINEMSILIYQGMLNKILSKNPPYTVEESINKTLKYFKQIIKSYSK